MVRHRTHSVQSKLEAQMSRKRIRDEGDGPESIKELMRLGPVPKSRRVATPKQVKAIDAILAHKPKSPAERVASKKIKLLKGERPSEAAMRLAADVPKDVEPGAKVARDLGIYLGQIYGWIKKGSVKNYKLNGYPMGPGIEVSVAEVSAARDSSKGRRRRKSADGEVSTAARAETSPRRTARRAQAIATVEHEQGDRLPDGKTFSGTGGVTRYGVAWLVGRQRSDLIALFDDGKDAHRLVSILDGDDRAAILDGPEAIIGYLIYKWVAIGDQKCAESLEAWADGQGIEIKLPEVPELADEPTEDVAEEESED